MVYPVPINSLPGTYEWSTRYLLMVYPVPINGLPGTY